MPSGSDCPCEEAKGGAWAVFINLKPTQKALIHCSLTHQLNSACCDLIGSHYDLFKFALPLNNFISRVALMKIALRFTLSQDHLLKITQITNLKKLVEKH